MEKDFGDILEQWERQTAVSYGKKRIAKDKRIQAEKKKNSPAKKQSKINELQEIWLRRYGVINKDEHTKNDNSVRQNKKPDKIRIDAKIDLHGLNAEEAEIALESFFDQCVSNKLHKVLIIHGKGNHSTEEPVLKKLVKNFIERHKHAGKSGSEKGANGGSGATWVLIK